MAVGGPESVQNYKEMPNDQILIQLRRFVDPSRYIDDKLQGVKSSFTHSDGSTNFQAKINKRKEIEGEVTNLLSCGCNDFIQCLNLFNEIFKRPLNLQEQVNVMWLYTAFYTYMSHWKQEPIVIDRIFKIDLLDDMNKQFFKSFAALVCEVNKVGFIRNNNLKQKLLQIHYALPAMHNYMKSEELTENVLMESLPFGFNERLISSCRDLSERRPTSVSATEKNTNQSLLNGLKHAPADFAPVLENSSQSYVDPKTGLELDFPLQGKVTIETDGQHHLYPNSIYHEPIHSFKSLVLREAGYIRVPITLTTDDARGALGRNNQALVNSISLMLGSSTLLDMHGKYQALVRMYSRTKDYILGLQNHINNLRSSDDKAAYAELLSEALNIKSQLYTHVFERDIEKALRELALNGSAKLRALEKLSQKNRRVDEIRQNINIWNNRIEQATIDIRMLEQKCANEFGTKKSLEERSKEYDVKRIQLIQLNTDIANRESNHELAVGKRDIKKANSIAKELRGLKNTKIKMEDLLQILDDYQAQNKTICDAHQRISVLEKELDSFEMHDDIKGYFSQFRLYNLNSDAFDEWEEDISDLEQRFQLLYEYSAVRDEAKTMQEEVECHQNAIQKHGSEVQHDIARIINIVDTPEYEEAKRFRDKTEQQKSTGLSLVQTILNIFTIAPKDPASLKRKETEVEEGECAQEPSKQSKRQAASQSNDMVILTCPIREHAQAIKVKSERDVLRKRLHSAKAALQAGQGTVSELRKIRDLLRSRSGESYQWRNACRHRFQQARACQRQARTDELDRRRNMYG